MLRSSAYPMVDMERAWTDVCDAVFECGRGSRSVPLTISSQVVGSVLKLPAFCQHAVPSLPCSRLDGYALQGGQPAGVFTVVAQQRVGHAVAAQTCVRRGEAAWVTTGAPLPSGTDAVVGIERTEEERPLPNTVAEGATTSHAVSRVRINAAVHAGDNVRLAGSDIAAGEYVLPAGHVLTPADVGLLLSAGIAFLDVFSRARVTLLSTGDELLLPNPTAALPDVSTEGSSDAQLRRANRVVDSNRPMLRGLLATEGCCSSVVDGGVVTDDFNAIHAAMSAWLQGDSPHTREEGAAGGVEDAPDVLITTGGVSMGDRDYVKPALEKLVRDHPGSRVLFGRLNMKPGKPTMCALLYPAPSGEAAGQLQQLSPRRKPKMVFCLPGNPVSAWVCCHLLALPALRCMMGMQWERGEGAEQSGPAPESTQHATSGLAAARQVTPIPWCRVMLLDSLPLDPERPEFHRVTVWQCASSGRLVCRSTGAQASSRLASTTSANGLAWLPRGSGSPAGGSGTAVAAPLLVDVVLVGDLLQPFRVAPELRDTSFLRSFVASTDARAAAPYGGCGCDHHHSLQPPALPLPSAAAAAAIEDGVGGAPPPPVAMRDRKAVASAAAEAHSTAPHAAGALAVTLHVLTVSDRCSSGAAADASGPAVIAALLASLGDKGCNVRMGECAIVPDDAARILSTVSRWAQCDATHPSSPPNGAPPTLIVTTGGTGFGTRDVTPEALRGLITRPTLGLVYAMLAAGLKHTPLAALSRYEAGMISPGVLLLELPGSVKAVRECLAAVTEVLPHALALMRG